MYPTMAPPNYEKTLLESKISSTSDEEFINRINNLAISEGAQAVQQTFKVLTGIDIPQDDCLAHWEAAQVHRSEIITQLKRNVDVTTTLCDYFQQKTDYLENPRLIEAQQLEEVIKKTIVDKLTGLYNRRYFDEVYDQHVVLAESFQESFTVLFLDIDNFKMINDYYGHRAGDKVLQEIAEVISDEKRDSDIAARYGGEEFVLLLTSTDNRKAYIFAERLRKRVASHVFRLEGDTVNVTLSGGIATFPTNSDNPTLLLQMADRAMYLSKGAGKNRITHFRDEKRRFLRTQVNNPVKVKKVNFDNAIVQSGTCIDVSVGGIHIKIKEKLTLGELIQVQVPLKNEDLPVIFIGTVIRTKALTHGYYGIGIATSFRELDNSINKGVAALLPSDQLTD